MMKLAMKYLRVPVILNGLLPELVLIQVNTIRLIHSHHVLVLSIPYHPASGDSPKHVLLLVLSHP
jgi:hypothetical protein